MRALATVPPPLGDDAPVDAKAKGGKADAEAEAAEAAGAKERMLLKLASAELSAQLAGQLEARLQRLVARAGTAHLPP